MKRISLTLFAAILLIAATLTVSAQETQNRQVSGFNGIVSGGPFNVHVKIDGSESVKLTADKDVINEIETVVEDSKLQIRFKNHHEWNHENYGKIDVEITAKSLSSLTIASSGKFVVDGGPLTGENVKLTISGSGNITTAIKAEQLHAVISGSGNIMLNGSVASENFTISGSGSLKAQDLKAGTALVSIAGSGSARIDVEKTISAHIAGSGSVTYSGSASVTDFRSAGSGSISRAK